MQVGDGRKDSAAAVRMRRAALLLAWAGAIAAAANAAAVASTFLPGAPHLPPAVTTTASVAAVPIMFGATFIAENGCPDRLRSSTARKQLLSRVPLPARRIATHALVLETRIFSGVAMGLQAGAVILATAAARRPGP